MKYTYWIALAAMVLVGASCTKKNAESDAAKTANQATGEAQRITVQHILIGFKGSLPGKEISRSKDDALTLAKKILEDAKAPDAKFEALVKANTDDQAPGIYSMSNFGVAPSGDEFPRDQMVPAFGDVGFKLQVGEIGLAEYDQQKSPYGFHIIKRLN